MNMYIVSVKSKDLHEARVWPQLIEVDSAHVAACWLTPKEVIMAAFLSKTDADVFAAEWNRRYPTPKKHIPVCFDCGKSNPQPGERCE